MRLRHLVVIAISCTEGIFASLAPNCIKAFNSISPRRFIEAAQHESCKAGCSLPTDLWGVLGKDTMHKLAEDGSSYLGIQEGKEGMVDFLDTMFQELRGRCGSAFEEAQLEGCQDSLQAKNAIKCAEDNSRTAKMHALKFLLPYITADRCKKVGEYFESTQLWETSFPKHAQNQVNSCNEL